MAPRWWPNRLTPELAPFRSGQGWPDDQGRTLPAAAEVEDELYGPPRVVPAASCPCGDFRCLGDATGNGCMSGVAWQADPRFLAGPDGLEDVAGMGWRPDLGPEVWLWAQHGDSLLWLDAHPTGSCRNPLDPNCQGGCGG